MKFGLVGAGVGAVMLAPAGLGGYGAAVGFLLGLWVGFAERSARDDPGWSEDNAATKVYRVGSLAIGALLVALALIASGLAASWAGR